MIRNVFLFVLILMAADVEAAEEKTPTIQTGIWGVVQLNEGDCMPVVGEEAQRTCLQKNAAREVYILESVKNAQMDVTYLKAEGKIIRQVTSGRDGFYQVALPDGVYSVFVDDDGKKYCNYFGGDYDEVCQVIVRGSPEKFDIAIDRATW